MSAKARLMIAAAVLIGTGSIALAQSARHDYSDDQINSYGPVPQERASAAATANPAQAPVGRDTYNAHDASDDNIMSYGVRN